MLLLILNVYATSDITPFPYHAKHPFDGILLQFDHTHQSPLSPRRMAGLQLCLQLDLATRVQCKSCLRHLGQTFCTGRR